MSTEPRPVASLTRRRLVKVGATSAWAVPAITLVTSAPALAASGTAPKLTVTVTKAPVRASNGATFPNLPSQNQLSFTALVRNLTDVDVSSVELTVMVVPSDTGFGSFQSSTTTTPSGWTVSQLSSGSGNGVTTAGTYTFIYLYNVTLPAGTGMVEISPVITLGPTPDAGSISIQSYADMNPPSAAIVSQFT